MHYLTKLPPELIEKILNYLEPQDRINLSQIDDRVAELVEKRKLKYKQKCYKMDPMKEELIYELIKRLKQADALNYTQRDRIMAWTGMTPRKRRPIRRGRSATVSLDELYIREVNTVACVDNIEVRGWYIFFTVQFVESDYRCIVDQTVIWRLRDGRQRVFEYQERVESERRNDKDYKPLDWGPASRFFSTLYHSYHYLDTWDDYTITIDD